MEMVRLQRGDGANQARSDCWGKSLTNPIRFVDDNENATYSTTKHLQVFFFAFQFVGLIQVALCPVGDDQNSTLVVSAVVRLGIRPNQYGIGICRRVIDACASTSQDGRRRRLDCERDQLDETVPAVAAPSTHTDKEQVGNDQH